MCWCNYINRSITCILLVALFTVAACRPPHVKEPKGRYKYFDLKGYMHKDSARISALNPTVDKTVNHNGETETRKLKITNWGNELGLFTASDINKPSWYDSYTISNTGDSLIYQAKTPGLKTQRLIVSQKNNKVTALHIFNHTKNILYETSEELTYIPDSIYAINKNQHVILLGNNRYIIKGKFLK